jgi:uncharacterized Ntn-hydrolase superfamily protein
MRAHVGPLLAVSLLAACRPAEPTRTVWVGDTLTMNTWSVVGVDPKTGDVGVAMASCVRGTIADALGALVPGKGAGATQAGFSLPNRNRVFAALKEGVSAEEVIKRVTDTTVDRGLNGRQYGIVTMKDGRVQTAAFTGQRMLDSAARPVGPGYRYAGVKTGTSADGMVVSAQGNTLAAEAVVADPVAAFVRDDPAGFNLLPDRLMRAIEAGSHAGGDVRCNNASTGTRQTAATVMIIAARGTDSAYATDSLGKSDQGTAKAPWLNIAYAPPRASFENPLLELRKRYDTWRRRGMKQGDGGGN